MILFKTNEYHGNYEVSFFFCPSRRGERWSLFTLAWNKANMGFIFRSLKDGSRHYTFSVENPIMLNFSILHKVVKSLGQINKHTYWKSAKSVGKGDHHLFGLIKQKVTGGFRFFNDGCNSLIIPHSFHITFLTFGF